MAEVSAISVRTEVRVLLELFQPIRGNPWAEIKPLLEFVYLEAQGIKHEVQHPSCFQRVRRFSPGRERLNHIASPIIEVYQRFVVFPMPLGVGRFAQFPVGLLVNYLKIFPKAGDAVLDRLSVFGDMRNVDPLPTGK